MAACGRCGGVLEPAELGGVPFEGCTSCNGLLLEQPRFVKLLEALTETLGDLIAMEGVIPAVPDPGGAVACPRCARPMQRVGYMETKTVFIDRCGRCNTVWIDQAELESAVMMHARVTRRAAARQTELAALADRIMRMKVPIRGRVT